ncbi:hypothetical protein EV05_1755 [Prochlorococcus sp. MIT 0601]|nr:hypothetical protein EV05_1755 [Prochlorococcus sp. MIT 0601]
MIASLQKEIFNRRRKKVTAQGVVETLVESAAKSQSDKRYAASWKNLIKDIEKAAKQTEVHGNKPANISSEEWALILSHRTRKVASAKKPTPKTVSNKSKTKKTSESKKVVKNTDKTKAVGQKLGPITTEKKPRKARRARRASSTASQAK